MNWHSRAQRRRISVLSKAVLLVGLAVVVFTPKMDVPTGLEDMTGFGPLITSAQAEDVLALP